MRLFVVAEPGRLELNYMWLPTWIGMNRVLTQSLDSEMSKLLVEGNRSLTTEESDMDFIDDFLIEALCRRFPSLTGLREHLRSLKGIDVSAEGRGDNGAANEG